MNGWRGSLVLLLGIFVVMAALVMCSSGQGGY